MGSVSSSFNGQNCFALVGTHAVSLFSVNVGLWLLSLKLGKTWPVDFIWSTWPIVQGEWLGATNEAAPHSLRNLLTMIPVYVWGVRLTWNFILRGGIGHEDWRYSEMRSQQGRFFWIGSLFTVFLGQSCFMFSGCLSLYPALCSETPPWALPAGVAIMASATLIEATADRQMDAFLTQQPKERDHGEKDSIMLPKHVMDRGLWAWSRHPNYFGEWLFWVGMWIAGGAQCRSFSFVGPSLVTVLFLGISVDMMERRQLERRGEAFRSYQRRVPSSFFPLPPSFQKACMGAKDS